ncbi:Glycoside hydrolase 2 Mannanase beta-galactosidase [Conglomerata obtusa]
MNKTEKHLKPHQAIALAQYIDRKTQIPIPNMCYKDTIPLITLLGPPNSGQDVLFTKLATHFTNSYITTRTVTISTNARKFTLHNAKPTLETYIDCVKTSDIVVLTISGTSLELETFEIISLLKAHGLCKIVIAYDFNLKEKRRSLKTIKKRLWREVAGGLKLYDINLESDIKKLARDIVQMKVRPLQWRCSNSYVVLDRVRECDDVYECYGYVRGCPMKGGLVHIPGNGDYEVRIEEVQDPCDAGVRRVLDKEKKIYYAPEFFMKVRKSFEEVKEVKESQSEESEFNIYNDVDNNEHINTNDACNEVINESIGNANKNTTNNKEKINFNNEEDINNHCDNFNTLCNSNVIEDGINNDDIKNNLVSINETNYGDNTNEKNTCALIERLKNKLKNKFENKPENEDELTEKFNKKYETKSFESEKEVRNITEQKNMQFIKDIDIHVPGTYVKIEIKKEKKIFFNEFTILGEVKIQSKVLLQGKVKRIHYFPYTLKSNERYLTSIGWRREYLKVVFSLKDPTRNRFLKYILENMHCNANFNSNIVEPGTSFCIIQEKKIMRVSEKVSSKQEIINNHTNINRNRNKDITNNETDVFKFINGNDNVNKITTDSKAYDNFKIFSKENGRTSINAGIDDRTTKDDNENFINDDSKIEDSCITCNDDELHTNNIKSNKIDKPNSTNYANEFAYEFTQNHFRIAACGNINDVSGKTNMLKKLKLIGYPSKINENTVFVKDMFSSDKEVTKFEGALLRTVGGIRGCVKKSVGYSGSFRATFEGRLLMSDIIYMRCFVPYEIDERDINNQYDNIKSLDKPVPHTHDRSLNNTENNANTLVNNCKDSDNDYKHIETNFKESDTVSKGINNNLKSIDNKLKSINSNFEMLTKNINNIEKSNNINHKSIQNINVTNVIGRELTIKDVSKKSSNDGRANLSNIKNEKENNFNRFNLTDNIENKKIEKINKIKNKLQNKLIDEKLKKVETFYVLPISPNEEEFEQIKKKVDDKRKSNKEKENKNNEERIKRYKKECEKIEKEKNERLRKNILENKNEKLMQKKGKRKGKRKR